MPTATSSYQHSQAIAAVYSLLSRFWLREIDQDLIRDLQRDPLREAFVALGGVLPHESIDDLAAEYCRLFIGPRGHLPPAQSVWQRGELSGEATSSVRKFAELLGVHIPSGILVDHLGVELDLMAHAILGLQSHPEQACYREITSEFFRRHLTWTAPLLEASRDRAVSPCYRSVIQITGEFLLIEARHWCSESA